MSRKLKCIIATHKTYEFPSVDYYVPIHVGKACNNNELRIQGDNIGDNISLKTALFVS